MSFRPPSRYVADTHAIFWYLTDSPRLSRAASAVFDRADTGEAVIYLPAIVLAELYFLNEKLGHPLDFVREFERLRQSGQFILIDFTAHDVLDFDLDAAVSEMHDRMIAGVARRLNAPCITCDRQIITGGIVATIW